MNSLPRTSGIYLITCTANGKIYIGSTINFRSRWAQHKSLLNKREHKNPPLQHAWNKYGESAFVCEVLELCSREMLFEREQHYLNTLTPFPPNGFNVSRNAERAMLGQKVSPERLEQMRVIGLNQSAETRAKIGATHKGMKRPPETGAKISAALKGHKKSPEHCANLSAAQKGRKGRSLSEKTRQILRDANIGKKASPEKKEKLREAAKRPYFITSPEGETYHVIGLIEFCRNAGIDRGAMGRLANGKQSYYKGWRCEHATDVYDLARSKDYS